MQNQDKKSILLFELGHLQVFCYQTLLEWSNGYAPKEIYWQKRGEPKIHGPFNAVYTAVQDYSLCIQQEKDARAANPDNVILVDFKTRKRIR